MKKIYVLSKRYGCEMEDPVVSVYYSKVVNLLCKDYHQTLNELKESGSYSEPVLSEDYAIINTYGDSYEWIISTHVLDAEI